jgi:hypothetical protein
MWFYPLDLFFGIVRLIYHIDTKIIVFFWDAKPQDEY